MGPWGSLVSLQLGVLLTPVQIWAGPYSFFRLVFFQAFSFMLAALGAAPKKNTGEKENRRTLLARNASGMGPPIWDIQYVPSKEEIQKKEIGGGMLAGAGW